MPRVSLACFFPPQLEISRGRDSNLNPGKRISLPASVRSAAARRGHAAVRRELAAPRARRRCHTHAPVAAKGGGGPQACMGRCPDTRGGRGGGLTPPRIIFRPRSPPPGEQGAGGGGTSGVGSPRFELLLSPAATYPFPPHLMYAWCMVHVSSYSHTTVSMTRLETRGGGRLTVKDNPVTLLCYCRLATLPPPSHGPMVSGGFQGWKVFSAWRLPPSSRPPATNKGPFY